MNEITKTHGFRDPFAQSNELTVQKEVTTERKDGKVAMTMTSLEISELVGSEHSKVRQSIERLAERGVISLCPMGKVKVIWGQSRIICRIARLASSPNFIGQISL